MRLESIACTGKLAFHIALGPVNVVSENVKSRPIALRLNGHWFLRLWSHRVTQAQLGLKSAPPWLRRGADPYEALGEPRELGALRSVSSGLRKSSYFGTRTVSGMRSLPETVRLKYQG